VRVGRPRRGAGERGELGLLLKMAEPATNMSAPASAISLMFAGVTPPSTCYGAQTATEAQGRSVKQRVSGSDAFRGSGRRGYLLPPSSVLTWSEMG
jgi:hypothetical protein